MDTRTTVLSILAKVKPSKNLEGVTDIIEGGYLDSFELITLISGLTETFGIVIDIDDINPDNFNSVDAMAAMVDRLRK